MAGRKRLVLDKWYWWMSNDDYVWQPGSYYYSEDIVSDMKWFWLRNISTRNVQWQISWWFWSAYSARWATWIQPFYFLWWSASWIYDKTRCFENNTLYKNKKNLLSQNAFYYNWYLCFLAWNQTDNKLNLWRIKIETSSENYQDSHWILGPDKINATNQIFWASPWTRTLWAWWAIAWNKATYLWVWWWTLVNSYASHAAWQYRRVWISIVVYSWSLLVDFWGWTQQTITNASNQWGKSSVYFTTTSAAKLTLTPGTVWSVVEITFCTLNRCDYHTDAWTWLDYWVNETYIDWWTWWINTFVCPYHISNNWDLYFWFKNIIYKLDTTWFLAWLAPMAVLTFSSDLAIVYVWQLWDQYVILAKNKNYIRWTSMWYSKQFFWDWVSPTVTRVISWDWYIITRAFISGNILYVFTWNDNANLVNTWEDILWQTNWYDKQPIFRSWNRHVYYWRNLNFPYWSELRMVGTWEDNNSICQIWEKVYFSYNWWIYSYGCDVQWTTKAVKCEISMWNFSNYVGNDATSKATVVLWIWWTLHYQQNDATGYSWICETPILSKIWSQYPYSNEQWWFIAQATSWFLMTNKLLANNSIKKRGIKAIVWYENYWLDSANSIINLCASNNWERVFTYFVSWVSVRPSVWDTYYQFDVWNVFTVKKINKDLWYIVVEYTVLSVANVYWLPTSWVAGLIRATWIWDATITFSNRVIWSYIWSINMSEKSWKKTFLYNDEFNSIQFIFYLKTNQLDKFKVTDIQFIYDEIEDEST